MRKAILAFCWLMFIVFVIAVPFSFKGTIYGKWESWYSSWKTEHALSAKMNTYTGTVVQGGLKLHAFYDEFLISSEDRTPERELIMHTDFSYSPYVKFLEDFPHPWPETKCVDKRFAGFQYTELWSQGKMRNRSFTIPLLPFLLFFALIVFLHGRALFRNYIKNNRKKHGLCTQCAYDIRANIECCSECGTPIPT